MRRHDLITKETDLEGRQKAKKKGVSAFSSVIIYCPDVYSNQALCRREQAAVSFVTQS